MQALKGIDSEVDQLVRHVAERQQDLAWVTVKVGVRSPFSKDVVERAIQEGRLVVLERGRFSEANFADGLAVSSDPAVAERARQEGFIVVKRGESYHFVQLGYSLRTDYCRQPPPEPEHARLCDLDCPRRYSSAVWLQARRGGHAETCPMRPGDGIEQFTFRQFLGVLRLLHRRWGAAGYVGVVVVATLLYVFAHVRCSVRWQ